ncbi:MAG: hypothetical protein AAFQ40_06440 [Cyanobacteria bacterium J06623_5]
MTESPLLLPEARMSFGHVYKTFSEGKLEGNAPNYSYRQSNSGASATVSITTNVITDTTIVAITIGLLLRTLIPAQWKSVNAKQVTETNTKDEPRASNALALFLVYYYHTTLSIPTRPPRHRSDSQLG